LNALTLGVFPLRGAVMHLAAPAVYMGRRAPVPVRPSWAQSWRWKSSRELATASEVNPNCGEATDRGEEGWIETVSRCTRNGYEAEPTRASGRVTAKLLWSRVGVVDPAVVR